MSDCPRFGKFWNGCRFQARFDESEPTLEITQYRGSMVSYIEALKASKKRTYVRDVCIRCGRTVERKPA